MTCHKLRADLVAGLTVGVMVIPQSMSYGAIAGCLGRLGRGDGERPRHFRCEDCFGTIHTQDISG